MRTGKSESKISGEIILLMIIFLIGLGVGAILLKTATESQQATLKEITDGFIESRQSHTFISNLCSSLFSTSVFLIIAFFTGYFALGKPVAGLIPFFKGLGLGISMADIFSRYGKEGYLICLVLILPSALINSIAIIVASKEAAKNSAKIFSFLCGKEKDENEEGISSGTYIIKFAVLFVIALIGAVLDAGLAHFFAGML